MLNIINYKANKKEESNVIDRQDFKIFLLPILFGRVFLASLKHLTI